MLLVGHMSQLFEQLKSMWALCSENLSWRFSEILRGNAKFL